MQSQDPLKVDFRIARVNGADVKFRTDHYLALRNLLLSNDEMYPEIKDWMESKVDPELGTARRTGFVAYVDGRPAVSAIVKRGGDSKFCHLKVLDDFQGVNLGEAFFTLMTLEARSGTTGIHFTLPEGLWEREHAFFRSFGFSKATMADKQYRFFENELRCAASFETVWNHILEKLPRIARNFSLGGYSMDDGILLSVKPRFARQILNGEKRVEMRRVFSSKWEARKANLYSTSPEQALVGEVFIERVVSGDPDELWAEFGGMTGCSKEEYDNYAGSAKEMYAIVLDNPRPYREPLPLSHLSWLMRRELRPPQSYCTLEGNKPWSDAVSIAVVLHASLIDSGMVRAIDSEANVEIARKRVLVD